MTLKRRQWRHSGALNVNFEHSAHLLAVFSMLIFKQIITAWVNLLRTHDIISHPEGQISLDSKKCCVALKFFIGEYYFLLGLSEIWCPAFPLWSSWVKFNHDLSLELRRTNLTLMIGGFLLRKWSIYEHLQNFCLRARYEKI